VELKSAVGGRAADVQAGISHAVGKGWIDITTGVRGKKEHQVRPGISVNMAGEVTTGEQ